MEHSVENDQLSNMFDHKVVVAFENRKLGIASRASGWFFVAAQRPAAGGFAARGRPRRRPRFLEGAGRRRSGADEHR